MTKRSTKDIFDEDEDTKQISSKPTEEKVETVKSPEGNVLDLPSKGLLGYPSQVEYRDIMFGDEEKLASASAENYARTMAGVLKSILMKCDFFEDMTIHDRDYALVWLWANNYASIKKVPIKCPHCKHEETVSVDLTKLNISDINEKIEKGFSIKLKKTDTAVKIKMYTVAHEIEAERYAAANENTDIETIMLALSIDLGLPLSTEHKLKWVRENVSAKEMGHIKNFHRYFAYGVPKKIEHTCSECEGVTNIPLPFSAADILYPETLQDDFERML